MRVICWATDIHLDLLDEERRRAFYEGVNESGADMFLVSGDIGEAPSVCDLLLELDRNLTMPVAFILGNHDFYRGKIERVRWAVTKTCGASTRLRYLTSGGSVRLSDRAALVGHDGWYDLRLGLGRASSLRMGDFEVISDFFVPADKRASVAERLSRSAARQIRASVISAFASYDQVVVLTHVPPFREACWHGGMISNDTWLPYFTSKAMGDALMSVAKSHPRKRLVVLCGHSHGRGTCRPLSNLEVYTGGAQYDAPEIQPSITIDDDGFVVVDEAAFPTESSD